MQPYEVICAPYTVFIAPIGTPPPTLDPVGATYQAGVAPVGNPTNTGIYTTGGWAGWTSIGTAGAKSYMDVGVTVTHSQTLGTFVPGGSTAIRKAWRQSEELVVAFSLADMSPAQYALQLNNNPVVTATSSGTQPASQNFEVYRGVLVQSFAMLVRGVSPFNELYAAQYEIAACYNAGAAAPVFSKQGPAVLAVEWHAYELNPGALATFRAASGP